MIKLNNISKSFKSINALNDVCLEIQEGEFFGLLGPNGAGKTTLMNILIGYLYADSGSVYINGEEVKRTELKFRSELGFVPQSVALYGDLTAEENLKFFGSLYNIDSSVLQNNIKDYLNAVGLYERRKDTVKNFSGGMKRRLNLITALLHNPKVLLCDEPTVGVDPQSRNAIFDFLEKLNREGLTIVYTTHYMEEAERLCNRVAIIDNGNIIAAGTTDELLKLLPEKGHIFVSINNLPDLFPDLNRFGNAIKNQDKYEIKLNEGINLSAFVKVLEEKSIGTENLILQKPTLEELFLHLTGRRLRD
ncbi:MAG: ABC transporter ATP-binding protein [Candidatus Kapaibacterium sp.]